MRLNKQKIKKGDYVVLNNNINEYTKLAVKRGYLSENEIFLKEIAGVSGDTIRIEKNIVFVNDRLIGPLIYKDHKNQPMHIMVKPGIIPEKHYFLASTRISNSYDSRYFGLIAHEQISSKVVPILTDRGKL
jgi:conjugative transfer signal peptidase TraF